MGPELRSVPEDSQTYAQVVRVVSRGGRSGGPEKRCLATQLICAALLMAGLAAVPLGATAAGAATVRPNALSPGVAPVGASAVGSVPADQNLTISVAVPPSNQEGLNALLQGQSDPTSPEYHHWLARGQFATEFGPNQSDMSAVTSWLNGDGFSPTVSGYLVSVTAPESQLASTLGTSFENYSLPTGGTGYVASSTPQVPDDPRPGQIESIMGLNTAYPFTSQDTVAPRALGASPQTAHPNTDGLSACAGAANEASHGYYTLDQEGADYGIGSLLTAGQNGSGETVGLFELGQASASDLANYEGCFGLTNGVSVVPVDGGATSGIQRDPKRPTLTLRRR